MKHGALWVGWPSFIMAGVLEMVVFSLIDPADLHGWRGALAELSATAVYTLAFFCFWALVGVASFMTLRLASLEDPRAATPQQTL